MKHAFTLRFAPKSTSEKMAKRILVSVLLLSIVTALPGMEVAGVLSTRALAYGKNKTKGVCEMEIAKTGAPDEVAPGDPIAYTITFKNTGTANCTGGGVELREFYDPQTEFVSADPAPQFNTNNIWNFGTVEPGEEHTVTITVNTSSEAQDGDALINKACVWAEQFGSKSVEENWLCATTTTTVAIPPPPGFCELTLLKTATPDEGAPGDAIDYSVRLKNTGTANCTGGVELREFYDPQTEFVSADPAPQSGNDVWNFGTIEPGVEHEIAIQASASEQAQDGDVLTNKVCAWAEQFGAHDDMDNWVCAEVTTLIKLPPPSGECRLTVEKTDNPDPVMPESALNYTVEVSNAGDLDCTEVTLEDIYDSRTMFVSAQPDPATGNNFWNIGTLEPQGTYTVTIEMETGNTLQDGDVLHNQACAAAAEMGQGASVCDDEDTTVVKHPPSTANLVITKLVSDNDETLQKTNTAAMDEEMTYTISVENTGNFGAMEVVLTDDYDESRVSIVSHDGDSDLNGIILYQIGVINPGQKETKEIVVKVNNGFTATTTIDNIAQVQALSLPSVSDSVTTTVIAPPPPSQGFDLSLDKSVSPASVEVGNEITFTVIVTNEGTVDGAGIVVKDVLPGQLEYISDTGNGAFDKSAGEWAIGNLAVGSSTALSITANTLSNGTFENVAEVFAADQKDIDSTPNNNIADEDDQDSAVVTVREKPGPPGGCEVNCGGGGTPPTPKISVVKSVNKPQAAPGDIVTYTFTVTAGGTDNAENVLVTDTLPAGFTFMEGANSTRTWSYGTMDEQTSKTESYDVLIGVNVAIGTYENIVVATISNGVAPDNRSEARATVEVSTGGGGGTGPQLIIQKSASDSYTNPGAQLTYTVIVTNIGGTTATNVTLEDTLPSGFTFVQSGLSTEVFTLGDLAAGEARTFTYLTAVASDEPAGFYTNIATARAENASPVSDDADVEVRVVEVLGFTTLPDTGTPGAHPRAIAFIALLMLGAGAYLSYRFRAIVRETVRARVLINLLS